MSDKDKEHLLQNSAPPIVSTDLKPLCYIRTPLGRTGIPLADNTQRNYTPLYTVRRGEDRGGTQILLALHLALLSLPRPRLAFPWGSCYRADSQWVWGDCLSPASSQMMLVLPHRGLHIGREEGPPWQFAASQVT